VSKDTLGRKEDGGTIGTGQRCLGTSYIAHKHPNDKDYSVPNVTAPRGRNAASGGQLSTGMVLSSSHMGQLTVPSTRERFHCHT
jgi:hypothetical protein